MKAAWYERQGPAEEVLVVGTMPDPEPGPGEVRIALRVSGINPGDVKKRSDAFGSGMRFSRVIPHSDGSGIVDAVGQGVSPGRIGQRVWCFGAQSFRPFGTAAEFTVVPEDRVILLPPRVGYDQGACLGIPGITGHRAVHAAGPVEGRTVLVQGGAGAVGVAAVGVAADSGAHVLATVRNPADEQIARAAGAHVVIRTDGVSEDQVVQRIREAVPERVHHIVEVAFHANIRIDQRVLRDGGSVACYATGDPEPRIPFWPLVFRNITLFFLGSDDFTIPQKRAAGAQLTAMLEAGWIGFRIAHRYPLEEIAHAHREVERGSGGGRVLLEM